MSAFPFSLLFFHRSGLYKMGLALPFPSWSPWQGGNSGGSLVTSLAGVQAMRQAVPMLPEKHKLPWWGWEQRPHPGSSHTMFRGLRHLWMCREDTSQPRALAKDPRREQEGKGGKRRTPCSRGRRWAQSSDPSTRLLGAGELTQGM